jgi:hypothetical protein
MKNRELAMFTMTYEVNIFEDRTVTFKVPDNIPLGRHQLTLVVDEKPISDDEEEFQILLEQTKGTWQHGDGLAYQIKLREEWDKC